jgi:hypothetical protein
MSDDNAKAATRAETESDFRVFSTCGPIEGVTFYFIESTAPDNVEQRVAGDDHPPEGLTLVEPDKAIMKIVEQLVPSDEPEVDANLVVMVHEFNNPRESVLTFYRAAIEALKKDKDAIFSKSRRIVCIGYRWPSEARFSVLGSSLCALPLFPLWPNGGACAVLALRLWSWVASLPLLLFELAWLLTPPAFALIAITAVLALLRAIVYLSRDQLRRAGPGGGDSPDRLGGVQFGRRGANCGKESPPTHRPVLYRPQHGRAGHHQCDPRAFGRVRSGGDPHVPFGGKGGHRPSSAHRAVGVDCDGSARSRHREPSTASRICSGRLGNFTSQ